MTAFDYDVIVVGSGFGGSVAAMRATEKGYTVGVTEAGRRLLDADIPTTSWDVRKFVWQPEIELFGMQRIEYLEDVLVLSGAGVGGGSNTYANTLYVPPSTSGTTHSSPASRTGRRSCRPTSTRRSARSASCAVPPWTATRTG